MTDRIYSQIIERADALEEYMRVLRRDLHRFPEQGWMEVRTSSKIAKCLQELGYQVLLGREVCCEEARMGVPEDALLEKAYDRALKQGASKAYAEKARGGFTGVIGILDCGEGPVTALRFDMDALEVNEIMDATHRPAGEGFASCNPGVMHACGHDGHVAAGLGCAKLLSELKGYLHGTIKLIFQPAEEGVRGARAIVEKGHLDDVDYVIGNHILGRETPGVQICFSTAGTLATAKLDIIFRGKSAHAGMCPEDGKNAMMAAASAVLNIQGISRNSQGSTRVNVGRLQAGTARNVICDYARLEVEVRGQTTECNDYMVEQVYRIAKGAAQMQDCSCEIIPMGMAPVLESDRELLQESYELCVSKLRLQAEPPCDINFASEDFSYFVESIKQHGGKGIYFFTTTSCAARLHNAAFDFEEKDLCSMVKVFCGLVYKLNGRKE